MILKEPILSNHLIGLLSLPPRGCSGFENLGFKVPTERLDSTHRMRTTIASTPSSGTHAPSRLGYTAVHEMPEEWGVTPLNMKLLMQTSRERVHLRGRRANASNAH